MINKISLMLSITIMLTATYSVFAQPKAEDQIKYRQSGMVFMRWNMGIIKNQVVKYPQSYNKNQVINAANAIAAIANSGLESLFSADSATGKGWKDTRLKADYFKQPEEVQKKLISFKREANDLAMLSKTGDMKQIKRQFEQLFTSCKSCHKSYRVKQ